jgi:hypothetical protein
MLQLAVTPALLAADRFVDKENHGEIEPGTFVIYSPYGEKSQLSGFELLSLPTVSHPRVMQDTIRHFYRK